MTTTEKREYYNAYYAANKEKIKAQKKAYYGANKEERKAYGKSWYAANKEKIKASVKHYSSVNKEKIKAYKTAWGLNRRKTNIQHKLRGILRGRLYKAVKGKAKSGSAVKDLGCSITAFKQYIESKFQQGMTWDNYGMWHIDHVIPLATYDLTDRKQLLVACHYTNMQPLWASDNIAKHDNCSAMDRFFLFQPKELAIV